MSRRLTAECTLKEGKLLHAAGAKASETLHAASGRHTIAGANAAEYAG